MTNITLVCRLHHEAFEVLTHSVPRMGEEIEGTIAGHEFAGKVVLVMHTRAVRSEGTMDTLHAIVHVSE